MTKHILITGGAGFIGSRLTKALQSENANNKIWIFDNLHPQVHGADARHPVYSNGVTFRMGDVRDMDAMRKVVAEATPDLVYHLAAETGTGQSYEEVSRYCDVNVTGTAYLIEALRSVHAPDVRVVLASSRAVYGEGGYCDANGREYVGLSREAATMASGDFTVSLPNSARLPAHPILSHTGLPPSPESIYASTKLMQEYLLRQAGEGSAWKATILRLQNVYGPGQSLRNPYTGVLSIFSKQLLSGEAIDIYEDGEIARDFVYVDDVVRAFIAAGKTDLPHGTTIDIGLGQPTSILQAAELLMGLLGCPERELKITGQFRIGDIRYAGANISAASELLSWTPAISVEEGLSRLAEWTMQEYSFSEPEKVL